MNVLRGALDAWELVEGSYRVREWG